MELWQSAGAGPAARRRRKKDLTAEDIVRFQTDERRQAKEWCTGSMGMVELKTRIAKNELKTETQAGVSYLGMRHVCASESTSLHDTIRCQRTFGFHHRSPQKRPPKGENIQFS